MTNEPLSGTTSANHTNRAHAELGGSTADRWTNCPGSIFLLRTVPRRKAGAAAEAGTRIHELAERLLTNFLKRKTTGELVDQNLESVDPEDLDIAEGFVNAVWNKGLEETITGKGWGSEDTFVLDQPLDMWGTIDFWAVYIDDKGLRTGLIVDLKTGYHEVDALKNSQLAFYACSLRQWVQTHGKDLDRIRVAIYQPKAPGDPYKEVSYNAKQLDTWKGKFFKAAKQIFIDQKPKYKVGKWCRFCDAQAVCPKYGKDLAERSQLALIKPEDIVLPQPETLTDEALTKLLNAEDDIVEFLSQCRKYVINRHMVGKKLSGFKLVMGVRRRKWKDDEEQIAKQLEVLGVTDPYNKKLKAITQIEKIVGKKALEPLTQLSNPAPTLVDANDERQEIASSADMLEALPEEL